MTSKWKYWSRRQHVCWNSASGKSVRAFADTVGVPRDRVGLITCPVIMDMLDGTGNDTPPTTVPAQHHPYPFSFFSEGVVHAELFWYVMILPMYIVRTIIFNFFKEIWKYDVAYRTTCMQSFRHFTRGSLCEAHATFSPTREFQVLGASLSGWWYPTAWALQRMTEI